MANMNPQQVKNFFQEKGRFIVFKKGFLVPLASDSGDLAKAMKPAGTVAELSAADWQNDQTASFLSVEISTGNLKPFKEREQAKEFAKPYADAMEERDRAREERKSDREKGNTAKLLEKIAKLEGQLAALIERANFQSPQPENAPAQNAKAGR